MKKLYLLCLLLLPLQHLFAQDTTDILSQVQWLYDHLGRNDQNTGMLYDRTVPLSNISMFMNGYDTVNNYENWKIKLKLFKI